MTKNAPVDSESLEIGRRVRLIRKRRGLGLDVAAGLAGISKAYLSLLEKGQRGFNRRGLLDDLARALGCSVTDLTGEPYQPVDRDTAAAMTAVPGIQAALHNYRPDDVPDVRTRPLDQLVAWAQTANDHRDQSRLSLAGRDVGTLITELQVHALTAGQADRDRAATALVTACGVAGPVVRVSGGNLDLSAVAARHALDLARRHGNQGLIGFARWFWASDLSCLGAQDRARAVVSTGIDELTPVIRLSGGDTLPAEMLGMLHLRQAWIAARQRRGDEARAHLDEAVQRHGAALRPHQRAVEPAGNRCRTGPRRSGLCGDHPDAAGCGSAGQPDSILGYAPGPGPRAVARRTRPRRRGDPTPGHRRPPRATANPDETRSSGTWWPTCTADPAAGSGSWTPSATASASAASVHNE